MIIASIDIGSNGVLLLVVEANRGTMEITVIDIGGESTELIYGKILYNRSFNIEDISLAKKSLIKNISSDFR